MSSALEIHPGARATEARLLALVGELRDDARRDSSVLARPVRVIVPSRSLRLHVSERIATELGAVAGVSVQTLFGAAVEILDRAGEEEGGADLLVDVLARRLARDEAPLRDAFEVFRDGYRTVTGTVRDLLDAGFEVGHEDAALERLREAGLPRDERRRAEAVVKTAARVAAALEARGRGGRAALLARAREAFEEDPKRSLPSRLVVVHGFADVTGRAGDLIEAIARLLPVRVLIDHPSDPAEPGSEAGSEVRPDLGCAFTTRLVERLEGALGAAQETARDPGEGAPRLLRAPGAEAEAREVARKIKRILAANVRPERIGVVARDLPAHTVALRRQLERLGVPASALRARAPLDGAGRAVLALVELFEGAGRTPADRWLDATRVLFVERDGETQPRGVSDGLRLGLRVVGATRLDEAAELDPSEYLRDKDKMSLPVRTAVDKGQAKGDRGGIGFHARRAKLSGGELRGAVKAAQALQRRLARWPRRATLAQHLDELVKLRETNLGWRAGDRVEQRVRPALERLASGIGGEELSMEEFALLLRRALAPTATPSFCDDAPTAGGGVRVLDAMEARGRTFDHLFLLGLNRDEFPRVVREDPLLGEDARRVLCDILPDVPLPSRGRDEDRYLFAQLLSSSPHITVSWQVAGDDGKARVVSPLVERLLGEGSVEDTDAVAPIFPQDLERARADVPRTAWEHAVLGGLHRGRDEHEGRLRLALVEAQAAEDPGGIARTRSRVLAAHDGAFRNPESIVPWLGFLGPSDELGILPDPRREPLFLTRYEALARCPWQTVLARFLQLEPSPDPLDSLPGIDARLIGNVVHAVIEKVALRALGDDETGRDGKPELADVLARTQVPMPWPVEEELFALTLDVAHDKIRENRKPVPGLVRTIAECAWPHVLHAREVDRAEESRFADHGVLGAEVTGKADVKLEDGSVLGVRFRVDRIEKRGGKVVLTDYKTGKPKPSKDVKKAIPCGKDLQPLVYAIAATDAGASARGRFVFLKSKDEEGVEVVFDERGVEEHGGELAGALSRMVDAWKAGALFPRLVDGTGEKEPPACKTCDVAQACARGDSGARHALAAIARGELEVVPGGAEVGALWQLEVEAAAKSKARRGRS